MEWSKAKRYTIYLLIIVNIILLGLNIDKKRTNTVSDDRIENITNICKNYNISINCSLPEDITGKQQLGIKEYEYDYIKLQQIFFGGIADVKRTSDYTSVIFTKNDEKLVVENSKIVFTRSRADYTGYVNLLNNFLGEFNIQRTMGDKIFYYQSYNDIPVFSNYICVDNSVRDKMIITVNYSTIRRFIGDKENVIGADEAIYSAINSITNDIQGERVITSVEKGYYDSRTTLSQEATIPPVYAICVNDRVYFVNAYTGICYK